MEWFSLHYWVAKQVSFDKSWYSSGHICGFEIIQAIFLEYCRYLLCVSCRGLFCWPCCFFIFSPLRWLPGWKLCICSASSFVWILIFLSNFWCYFLQLLLLGSYHSCYEVTSCYIIVYRAPYINSLLYLLEFWLKLSILSCPYSRVGLFLFCDLKIHML